jgi:type 1 glutamine amidotransferase
LSDRLIANLRAFAHAGGAILAVHSAIASAKKQPSYAELLGASFAGHERPGPIELSGPAVGPDDEEPRSPSEFRLRDELYRIRPVADIEARAYAEPVREKPVQDPPEARANDAEIIAYRRELGRGRIAVCTLGHFAAVYPSVAFRCVLADALSYLIGDAQLGDAQP